MDARKTAGALPEIRRSMRLPELLRLRTGLQYIRVPRFMRILLILVAAGLAFCTPDVSEAETAGKIAGRIYDLATGDPLPGVNLVVLETDLRAISGPRGEYFIVNVPIGRYVVEARMIGYSPTRKTEVSVNTDLTAHIDFKLETTVLDLDQPLTITAARPLLRPDLTASSEVLTAADIHPLPVRSVSDLIALQNGTVRDGNGGLHVRGGRSGELAYYVDGTELRDPMVGGMGTELNLDSIEEVVINRGGFDAQYGDAMSGIVNIMTKEGATGFSGRFRNSISLQSQYDVTNGKFGGPQANGRNISASLSGRLPVLGKSGSFSIAGQELLSGNYLPHHSRQIRSLAGNITFRPHPLLKVKLGGHLSNNRQEVYDHRDDLSGMSYDFNLDGLPQRSDRGNSLNLSISHTLTPRTYYTARFFRYATNSKLAPSMVFDKHWSQWPGYKTTEDGRYSGQIYAENLQAADEYGGLHFTAGDDFLPWFRQSNTTYYGMRFDLSSQISYRNQIRFGMEGQWYRSAWDEKSFQQSVPTGERYEANPVEGAFYLQNKLELAKLIVNGGVRLDYFDTGQRFFVDMPTGSAELRNSPTKLRLSPRVGLSHPLTSRSLLRVSYGYFYQAPEFRFVYENLRRDLNAEIPRVGNPNLDPQKTVAYEVGIEHLITDDVRFGVTASYKQLTNLTSTTQIQYPGGTYSLFTNADFGRVQSLEFSLRRRLVRNFSGSLHYTVSSAEGNSSDPTEKYNRLANLPESDQPGVVDSVFPMAFDQRHTVTAVFSANTPPRSRWHFVGLPLRDIGLTLIGRYGSGMPYTPTNSLNEQVEPILNSSRLPATFSVDLRLRKRFSLGRSSYTFYTDVQNLFNRRNIIGVYSNTGSPTDDGYSRERLSQSTPELAGLRRLLSLDPQNFAPPREIRLGFELSF